MEKVATSNEYEGGGERWYNSIKKKDALDIAIKREGEGIPFLPSGRKERLSTRTSKQGCRKRGGGRSFLRMPLKGGDCPA